MRAIHSYRITPNQGRSTRLLATGAYEVIRVMYFVSVALKYDAFVFGFGMSLLRWNLDLPVLRMLGKKVIMNMSHGAEMRPPYIDGGFPNTELFSPETRHNAVERMAAVAANHRRRVHFIERHVDVLVGAALSSTQFATRRFINTLAIGVPFAYPAGDHASAAYSLEPEVSSRKCAPVRVLHSPSNPRVKGTDDIRAAIQRLQAKGVAIDYVEVIGRPHVEVLDELQRCDLVVDQLYSDGPLCGVGTEAAWFGKPVVVAGYGFDILERFVSPEAYPPSMTCLPDQLEVVLEGLLLDSKMRRNLGMRAQRFVHMNWNSTEVARRYARLLSRDIPHSWWIDPTCVEYVRGAGQPESVSRACVKALIDDRGVEALQLAHRPALEAAFIAFANEC